MVTFVETDYTEPDIKYTLIGTAGGNDPDTGDIYRGLDRFGRIVDSYWYDYGSSADVDRIKYGYDRSGNRLWRENVVAGWPVSERVCVVKGLLVKFLRRGIGRSLASFLNG